MIGWLAAAYVTTAVVLYFREHEGLNWGGVVGSLGVFMILPLAKIFDVITNMSRKR